MVLEKNLMSKVSFEGFYETLQLKVSPNKDTDSEEMLILVDLGIWYLGAW